MAIEGADLVKAAAFLGAGLSMGLGAIGPGVGEGMAAAKACEAIGGNPKEAGLLTRTMLVGQAVSESTGIYSLVIALLLLFVVNYNLGKSRCKLSATSPWSQSTKLFLSS